jgi:preprotein translocase subunit SecD
MKSIRWRVFTILALIIASAFALVPRSVKQRVYDSRSGQMRDTTIQRVPIKLGLDLSGGVHLALEIDQSRGVVADCADAIRRAERVVRTRIDEFGTTEPVIQVAGDCRLIVELPGTDPARAKSIVERTAFLEFRITDARDQFRLALPAIDAALRRAGATIATPRRTRPDHDAVSGLLTSDSTRARSDTTDAASSVTSPGVLSALLTPGRVPGEFLVADERADDVDRLITRPDVQQLIPRGLELRWGTVIEHPGAPQFHPLYALQSKAIITEGSDDSVLENGFYRAGFDLATGALAASSVTPPVATSAIISRFCSTGACRASLP